MARIRCKRLVEDFLDVRGSAERWLLCFSGPDRLHETLIVRFDRIEEDVTPRAGVYIVSKAGPQRLLAGVVDHLDGAGFTLATQPQLIELASGRACCLDRGDRAADEIDIHREAVVRIEIVVPDLVSTRLVECLQPRKDMGDVEPRTVRSEIDDMDVDVAQRAAQARHRRLRRHSRL